MKAMILAAGLGTRLKPLTDKMPKALIEVDGLPMLQRVIEHLKSQGWEEVIINVHHFSEKIKKFLQTKDFGISIKISDESLELKDTGGGIVKAESQLFGNEDEPVLIHNVDIISNASLRDLMNYHRNGDQVATLLVSERDSSRKLIFSKDMLLKGWHKIIDDQYKPVGFKKSKDDIEFAFSGIYVISRRGVDEMKKLLGKGKYSVMDYFLHPDRKGKIKGFCQKDLLLLDIGKPATLLQAPVILKKLDSDSID